MKMDIFLIKKPVFGRDSEIISGILKNLRGEKNDRVCHLKKFFYQPK